jgi:hypothetical protein
LIAKRKNTRRKATPPSAASELLAAPTAVASEIKHPLDTIEGCKERACALWSEIHRRHGRAATHRIFDRLGTPSTAQKRKLDEMDLQFYFDAAKTLGWTDAKTAEEFIKRNRKLPKEDKSPYGNSTAIAVLRKINRLRQPPRPLEPRRKPRRKPTK